MASVQEATKDRIKSPERRLEVELAVEEALVSTIGHAYRGRQTGDVRLRCGVRDESRLVVELIDSGVPFDPVAAPAPDVTAPIEERRPGGLGVHFIRKLADGAAYRREGNNNVLELLFRLDR
jgi:anti-sigma regulatory factor (Ser/Thr protein kinase)